MPVEAGNGPAGGLVNIQLCNRLTSLSLISSKQADS